MPRLSPSLLPSPVAASARKPGSLALAALALVSLFVFPLARAFDRPETIFKIFQFPADKIPRIDGEADLLDSGDGALYLEAVEGAV